MLTKVQSFSASSSVMLASLWKRLQNLTPSLNSSVAHPSDVMLEDRMKKEACTSTVNTSCKVVLYNIN